MSTCAGGSVEAGITDAKATEAIAILNDDTLQACPGISLYTCLGTCLQTSLHTVRDRAYTRHLCYAVTHACSHGYTHVYTQLHLKPDAAC